MVESREPKLSLSVVVVVYNMAREAARTLLSLSADYQRHIDRDDYEVIVVDNGSDCPIDPGFLAGLAGNFRLIRIDPASPSPAQAINRGLAAARGEIVGVMVDGARIATPGLLHFARHGARLYDKAIVATLGWYLGHDFQALAMQCGYDHVREDALLDSIDWPSDGYRLFDVGTMDESSVDGWFQPTSESNALFLRRELWELLGGVDERFDAPGGGLINLDTFSRVLAWPDAELVILLGEATFHQLHGGTNTNASPDRQLENWRRWQREYTEIRGQPYQVSQRRAAPTYLGTLPRSALSRLVRAAIHPSARHFEPPLGADFNTDLWEHAPSVPPVDGAIAALVNLARNEFRHGRFEASCGVARLIRERAPDEPEAQRLLSLVAQFVPIDVPPDALPAEYHLAIAKARGMLGDNESAASSYRAALAQNGDLPQAHDGLATLRMPGDNYLVWLERLYQFLAPETVIEVGVFQGASIALVPPPCLAIGIDPKPTIIVPLKTEAHIFTETSDAFFALRRHEKLLAGRPLSVAFIDGLHLYEQALRDFIALEALCGPRSVVLFHDTVPLDQSTQTRTRETTFHTGDVWKAVLCLRHYRPDLDIVTIATPPTGLTVVTNLDPTSRVLRENYEKAVGRFIDTPFSAIEADLKTALNIVPNDWSLFRPHLDERGSRYHPANWPRDYGKII